MFKNYLLLISAFVALANFNLAFANYSDIHHFPFKVDKISISSDWGCGVEQVYTLKCWGRNSFGQAPREIKYDQPIREIETFYDTTCVVLNDYSYSCFGKYAAEISEFSPVSKLKRINRNQVATCIIKTDDNLYCWSPEPYYSLKLGVFNELGRVSDFYFENTPFIQTSCFILLSGDLKCFDGLGSTPVIQMSHVKSIFIKEDSYRNNVGGGCALFENNRVKCWGDKYLVKNFDGAKNVEELYMGNWFGCLKFLDSNVRCKINQSTSPYAYGSFKYMRVDFFNNDQRKIKSFSLNNEAICGVRDDNSVSCIGHDSYGEISPID